MNIFVLDKDPSIAATYHYDKHVRKLILEAVQMMMTTYHICHDSQDAYEKFLSHPRSYKKSHTNHPCTVWTRTSLSNFKWLLKYAESLNEEYKYRWNKNRDHMSLTSIYSIINDLGYPNIPDIGLTPFAIAMPKPLINRDDPVESYRNYYMSDKKIKLFGFTKREPPEWLIRRSPMYEKSLLSGE
jgi:hypothetical protein